MSIRPIDFNGMVQNSQDVTNFQRQEENRGMVQQQNVSTQFEQQAQERPHKVNEKDDAGSSADSGSMKDAKDKGNGAYKKNENNKKKKKEQKQDRIVLKSQAQSFDMKI
ncbi:hypothetical protein [Eubacterium oxidoreducens]|uniref:Uncharacterized protein n=1 Tax=Eubacterium oxidoreducens TaxID=1732 RepID=A0A1G6APN3_EUBOX|nr:hypothetical protein [Eubacterium oxidoreducens]SDB10277.1 hypothetical protein SAMN02910417_00808 [Eubacterium oxidoreducens]